MQSSGPPPSTAFSRRGFLKGGLATTAAALVAPPASATPSTPDAGTSPASTGPSGQEQVALTTEVNGKAVSLNVHPDASALEVVRGNLQLKGCKLSCGHGACGACAMHLDGTPVAACLLPATALEGKKLTTIEGLGPELHPVQKAFMARDALQCGFCTPGFVMAGVAFYDRWRQEHGKATPDRDTVAAALAGHLCRCGAYPNLYTAVQEACAGRFDDPASEPTPIRREARLKVTGQARYTTDIQLDGQLEGRILRSPHAHARIKKIDLSQAQANPGVKGIHILTPEGRLVRFAGQEVVAIAAIDAHTAAHALQQIQVEYDVLQALISIEAAGKPDAAQIFPKDDRHPANASEGMALDMPWKGNLRGPTTLGSQKPDQARKKVEEARTEGGKRLSEGSWHSHIQSHTSLEPHSCVAKWDDAEHLTIYLSTQAVTHMADDIAERWKLKRRNVNVITEHTGGGFGAKNRLGQEGLAAIELARLTKKPVRIALTRAEELLVGGNRPGSDIDVSLVVDKDQVLEATTVKAIHSGGTAVGQNATIFFRLMYPKALASLEDYDMVTHAPPGEAFRAPGGPNAFWALEQQIDAMAHQLGIDPLSLRRKWDSHSSRVPLYDWVESLPVWKERSMQPRDTGRYRRGVGLATGCWFYFHQTDTQVELTASKDGIVATCAVQDMGNGARTVMATAIAEVLGIEPTQVEIHLGSSQQVRGPMSGGSRTTPSVGPAAEHAARQLRDALVTQAKRKWKLEDAKAGKGGVEHSKGLLPWSEILKSTDELHFIGRRLKDKEGYFLPIAIADLRVGKRLGGSAVVVELEVDTRLGKSRALRAWTGLNVGRIYVPQLARSQAEGGVIQGISYALYEERRLDPSSGRLISAGLEDYRIMGMGDCPEIAVHFHDEPWEGVEGGGVGLAELATITTAGAVGNAMFNATGWRAHAMPLRPDVVLKGVRS